MPKKTATAPKAARKGLASQGAAKPNSAKPPKGSKSILAAWQGKSPRKKAQPSKALKKARFDPSLLSLDKPAAPAASVPSQALELTVRSFEGLGYQTATLAQKAIRERGTTDDLLLDLVMREVEEAEDLEEAARKAEAMETRLRRVSRALRAAATQEWCIAKGIGETMDRSFNG